MEAAFAVIIVVVVAGGLIAGIWASAGSGEAYRQIGRGGLSLNDGSDRPAGERPGGGGSGGAGVGGSAAEREAEIRQMLEARSARRVARGQPAGDVEAELAELLRPAVDPGLEAEIRELVVARNARRERQGKPPLDVEAEVARQIRDLTS